MSRELDARIVVLLSKIAFVVENLFFGLDEAIKNCEQRISWVTKSLISRKEDHRPTLVDYAVPFHRIMSAGGLIAEKCCTSQSALISSSDPITARLTMCGVPALLMGKRLGFLSILIDDLAKVDSAHQLFRQREFGRNLEHMRVLLEFLRRSMLSAVVFSRVMAVWRHTHFLNGRKQRFYLVRLNHTVHFHLGRIVPDVQVRIQFVIACLIWQHHPFRFDLSVPCRMRCLCLMSGRVGAIGLSHLRRVLTLDRMNFDEGSAA